MPRTVSEIDALMLELSGKGVHHASKEMRDLREERKALLAPPTEEHDDMAGFAESVESAKDGDPLKSDEMRFTERCIERFELARDGNQTNLAKNLYGEISAKVRLWRTVRVIVADVGVGGEWPSWNTLGLRNGDGLPEQIRPVAQIVPRQPAVVIEPTGGAVRGIDPKPGAAAPTMAEIQEMIKREAMRLSDPVEQMKMGLKNAVGQEVGARPDAKKAPQSAAV